MNPLRRILTTPYAPQRELRTFLERAQTQETPTAEVTVAVPDAKESERLFGVPLAKRGLQPIFLRITNRGDVPLRLQVLAIDPNYFTPLEAAGLNHYSILKRLSTFGVLAWFVLPIILLILPFKLITAYRANRRMDERFQQDAFRLRPIAPGTTAEGFVFSRFDSGTKQVQVCLHELGTALRPTDVVQERETPHASSVPTVNLMFSIPVPGIAVDYHRRDFQTLFAANAIRDFTDVFSIADELRAMPATTTNHRGTGTGDPVNLIAVGSLDDLIGAFAGRWDETESISLATCWKTARSFLLGSEYRYSPVSSLYLFGRNQDIALQRSRRSINERLHLRLWLVPLTFHGQSVWVGQVSRDIGVRFTSRTWNLTTHRIDPDVDEARDYVVEDLLEAEHLSAAGYVDGVGACDLHSRRHNLTGDRYFTDGKRAVIMVSPQKTNARFVAWA